MANRSIQEQQAGKKYKKYLGGDTGITNTTPRVLPDMRFDEVSTYSIWVTCKLNSGTAPDNIFLDLKKKLGSPLGEGSIEVEAASDYRVTIDSTKIISSPKGTVINVADITPSAGFDLLGVTITADSGGSGYDIDVNLYLIGR